jgi:hypothetical protein
MFGFRTQSKGPSKGLGVIGFLMFAGASVLLAWNESRTVKMASAIEEMAAQMQNADSGRIDASLEGKPIYLSGRVETQQGVRDDYFEFALEQTLILDRNVEMYQWERERRDGKDVWEKKWSNRPESGSGSHDNPEFPIEGNQFYASDATLGAYQITEQLLKTASHGEQSFLPNELPQSLIEQGWTTVNNRLFLGKGTENSPQIGDVRVTFEVWNESEASLIGTQRGGAIETFIASNEYDVPVFVEGKISAPQLIQDEKTSNSTLGKVLMVLGGGGMALGLGMAFSGFVSWLTWIPLLGPAIERFAFWTGALIGAVLAMILFVGAWLWAHPIVFVALLALGSAAAIFVGMRKRQEPAFAGMAPPPPPPSGPMGPPPPPPR